MNSPSHKTNIATAFRTEMAENSKPLEI